MYRKQNMVYERTRFKKIFLATTVLSVVLCSTLYAESREGVGE
jgi:hypothetical protein